MRKLFLKLHLYSGLICFWYLMILGTSSLNFNHHFSFMLEDEGMETWSRHIRLDSTLKDDRVLSQTISDSLSLIGWPLPWETWHDTTGVFHFVLQHPGKRYAVDYHFIDQIARVQEHPRGFWGIFNALHGMGSVPNSMFMYSWKWYSRITVALVVFSVFSGIYVWYRNKRDKPAGIWVLLTSLVISLVWMFQLYFWG